MVFCGWPSGAAWRCADGSLTLAKRGVYCRCGTRCYWPCSRASCSMGRTRYEPNSVTGGGGEEAVSYTHLTLPTILLV
eukprot:2419993-Pyramimonas_sp.AAC.1